MAEKNSSTQKKISALVVEIRSRFPALPAFSGPKIIACATGDEWSVQQINSILAYRPWNEISYDEYLCCGADELRNYLTKESLAYYLPGIFTEVLNSIGVRPPTRLSEVVTQMVMPTTPWYQDVWEHFGDGLFSDWDTPLFLSSTNELIDKIDYIRASYDAYQLECVAQAIEVVESAFVDKSNVEFSRLVKKFASFWRP